MNEKEKERSRRLQGNSKAKTPFFQIFKQAFPQLFNVFLVFFVTLSVFPAVHSDIKPIENGLLIFNGKNYWMSLTCFLTFNVFAMLGSLTTSFVQFVSFFSYILSQFLIKTFLFFDFQPSSKFLWIPVVTRFAFIPLFLFCNYHPLNVERNLPVFITSDLAYWLIAVIMSFSSGYLSSLAMMYAPQTQRDPQYCSIAGKFFHLFFKNFKY